MKQLNRLILGVLALIFVLYGVRYSLDRGMGGQGSQTVVFYNWGDYIDPTILKDFEAETGYRVIYETFDSNEAMVAKIQQGGTAYDLAVPSEYMIEQMIEDQLLTPLDKSKIQGLENIDERFLNQPFAPNNEYSIPYFWGTLGILYNTEYVDEDELNHWDDLWNPKYRNQIIIYDGAREVMGIGLQSLGYSLNETDTSRLIEARDKMKLLMPNILALVADELKMHMHNQEAIIGITFSGEAAMAMENDDRLAYKVPSEGSNLWFDNIVIPHNAANPDGAYALINFLLRPDIAARNAEYIGYATPNRRAMELMDPEVVNDPAFYPTDDVIEHLEVYRGLGQEKLIEYNNMFLEVKLEPRD